jgi:hypothetical protein
MMIDARIDTSYLDDSIIIVKGETHYSVAEEFRLRNTGAVLLVDSITVNYRDRTGWAEHLMENTAYKWFEDGLILIASPYVNYTPNIFKVNYRHRAGETKPIPRYVKAAASLMAASVVLTQPKNIITAETIEELATLFGGDIDKIKSVSIEGISVSFDAPSAKDALSEMYRGMRDASKTFREQALEILLQGRFQPRFD